MLRAKLNSVLNIKPWPHQGLIEPPDELTLKRQGLEHTLQRLITSGIVEPPEYPHKYARRKPNIMLRPNLLSIQPADDDLLVHDDTDPVEFFHLNTPSTAKPPRQAETHSNEQEVDPTTLTYQYIKPDTGRPMSRAEYHAYLQTSVVESQSNHPQPYYVQDQRGQMLAPPSNQILPIRNYVYAAGVPGYPYQQYAMQPPTLVRNVSSPQYGLDALGRLTLVAPTVFAPSDLLPRAPPLKVKSIPRAPPLLPSRSQPNAQTETQIYQTAGSSDPRTLQHRSPLEGTPPILLASPLVGDTSSSRGSSRVSIRPYEPELYQTIGSAAPPFAGTPSHVRDTSSSRSSSPAVPPSDRRSKMSPMGWRVEPGPRHSRSTRPRALLASSSARPMLQATPRVIVHAPPPFQHTQRSSPAIVLTTDEQALLPGFGNQRLIPYYGPVMQYPIK